MQESPFQNEYHTSGKITLYFRPPASPPKRVCFGFLLSPEQKSYSWINGIYTRRLRLLDVIQMQHSIAYWSDSRHSFDVLDYFYPPTTYLFIYLYVVAAVSLGYIIRDDWNGDSKISDADRQGKFSWLNQGTERKQKSKNTFNGYIFRAWESF